MRRLSSHNWCFMCGRSLPRILACSKLSSRQTLIIPTKVPLKNSRMFSCNNSNRFLSVQFHIHSHITMKPEQLEKSRYSHKSRPNTTRDRKTLTAAKKYFSKYFSNSWVNKSRRLKLVREMVREIHVLVGEICRKEATCET
jgi:hypothetical protein